MSGFTDRRAVGVAALTLSAVAGGVLLALPSGAAVPPAAPATTAPAADGVPTVDLTPSFTSLPLTTAASTAPQRAVQVAAAKPQLPTFTRSFTYAKKKYGYRMVGVDPKLARTVKVATTVTPLRLTFSDHSVVAPSSAAVKVVTSSGLFKPLAFPGGKGQYGDVFMRTQFWSDINKGKRAWHVTLAAPKVKSALSLTVPSGKAKAAKSPSGGVVHLVELDWFNSQLQRPVAAGAPAAFTQFLGGNIILCGSVADVSTCGIAGYHSGTGSSDGVRTYSYQSYLSSNVFGAKAKLYGIAPMTHELAEWLADPWGNNRVPAWTEKSVPQYGCSQVLEVGDPLVGKSLVIKGQPYQDEAYLSYFARQKPSRAWAGRYSWFGNFKTYSSHC